LSQNLILDYVSWAVKIKKLKPSSIRAYLNCFSTIHKLQNLDSRGLKSHQIEAILKGAENLSLYEPPKKDSRKVMTLSLLRLIGNDLACTNENCFSKLVKWTALLIAFFGSFRLGEILPKDELSHKRLCFGGM
jgi:hypothetical protein